MPKINVNSTITVQDPALVSRKRLYPEVLLRNRKIQKSSKVVTAKDSVYYTDELETTFNKYIEIVSLTNNLAGNIGEIQFNNVVFAACPEFTWQNDTTLNIVGDLRIENSFNIDNIKTTSLNVKVNSNNWSFDSNGTLHLPNYTIPGNDGENSQTLILDNSGNLNWQAITSTYDTIIELSNSTGVVAHDFELAQVFYHTNIQSNFTTNITNLNLNDDSATSIHLILMQGATPYMCSTIQIDGVAHTINWVGGYVPDPTADFVDLISFSITRINLLYTVYAQLIAYG